MTAQLADEYVGDPIPMDRFDWERVIRRHPIQGSAMLLALTLATYADKDGTRVRPGSERLMRVTGLSKRTVARGLKELREQQLILLVKQGNRYAHQADDYRLTVPANIAELLVLDPDSEASPRVTGDTQTAGQEKVYVPFESGLRAI